MRFFAEHRDRALKALCAQGFGGPAASLAGTCNHDIFDLSRQFSVLVRFRSQARLPRPTLFFDCKHNKNSPTCL
jgi:hypothetical protein